MNFTTKIHSSRMRTVTATRCQYQGGISICIEIPPKETTLPPPTPRETPRKEHGTRQEVTSYTIPRKEHRTRQEATSYTPVDRQTPVKTLPSLVVGKIIFNDDGLLKHIMSYKTASYLLCVNSAFPFPGLLPHDLRCQYSGSDSPCPWLYLGVFRNK